MTIPIKLISGVKIRIIFNNIKNNPITDKQNTITAKKNTILNAVSILLYKTR